MSKAWPLVALGAVAAPVERPVVPVPGTEYRQIGVRLWGAGAYEREAIDGGQTKYRTLSRVEAYDIIMNKIWARNGSVAIVQPELSGSYGSSEFPTFAPNKERLDPQWFHWLTKTKPFWEQCDEKSRGTSGKNRIRPERFLEVKIPLPPLPEQRRIVARIEQLAAKIEEARRLKVLLTEEFDNLLPSVLKHLPLSADFRATTIGTCSRMSTGTTPPSDREDYFGGLISWFTPGDLSFSMKLGKSSRSITETAVQDGKARLFEPNTVLLVAIGGSLGKVALTHERCSANQQITGIKFSSEILPEYGFWWMRRLRRDLITAAPQATLPIINQERIGAMEIAIPPLSEQRRIVDYLDSLQAKGDSLKGIQAETAAELDALLPSVLDKAFEGKL